MGRVLVRAHLLAAALLSLAAFQTFGASTEKLGAGISGNDDGSLNLPGPPPFKAQLIHFDKSWSQTFTDKN